MSSVDMRQQVVDHLKSIASDAGLSLDIDQELEEGGSSTGGRRKKSKPVKYTRTATRTVRAAVDEGRLTFLTSRLCYPN